MKLDHVDRRTIETMLDEWAAEADEYKRLADVHGSRGQTDMMERYLDMECVVREKIAEVNGKL